MTTKTTFMITLQSSAATDAEAHRMLRLALKQLLRQHGLRCTGAQQLPRGAEPHANETTTRDV